MKLIIFSERASDVITHPFPESISTHNSILGSVSGKRKLIENAGCKTVMSALCIYGYCLYEFMMPSVNPVYPSAIALAALTGAVLLPTARYIRTSVRQKQQ